MNPLKKLMTISMAIVCFSLTTYSQDKPKAFYQVGTTKVTVWENKKEGEQGEFTVKSFKVEKTYKKGDKWESTNYFDLTELLQLKAAIDKAINEEAVKTKEETKEKEK